MEKKLLGMATDSTEYIAKRVGNANGEMDAFGEERLFDRVVVKHDLNITQDILS